MSQVPYQLRYAVLLHKCMAKLKCACLSLCKCVPSIMASIHIEAEKYHKVSEAYYDVSEAKQYSLNPYMDGGGEMILSICDYMKSIMALTHLETENSVKSIIKSMK